MKYYVLVILLISGCSYASITRADSSSLNLQLPSVPGNYQSDKFRAGELDCSNAIGSATNLEFGVTGLIDKGDYDQLNNYINGGTDVGVYARIMIPLGKRVKSRIDCNRLYDLELRKKQLEVMKLERELQQLRELQFED
tara:strand:+ start:219 stop:635 length:417 start_codon:yes stop_codon:yes gene_type:complete